MGCINVTDNTRLIDLGYGLKTKKGTLWRTRGNGFRIDWSKVENKDTLITTHFGTFTFIKAERVNKIWYWTLKIANKVFTMKRDQARKNKKLPKTAIVEIIKETVKRTTDFIKHQLCLPQPKDNIDLWVEEAERIAKDHNSKNLTKQGKPRKKGKWDTYEEFIIDIVRYCDIEEYELKFKYLFYIHNNIGTWKNIFRKLVKEYHPDTTPLNRNTREEIECIYLLNQMYENIKNI